MVTHLDPNQSTNNVKPRSLNPHSNLVVTCSKTVGIMVRARQMSDEADQHWLADDYQKVLGNIKLLVQDYVKSGDSEYARILC